MLIRAISFKPFATAIVVAGALLASASPASLESPERDALRPAASQALSFAIADQGNTALQQIRADSRDSIRHWQLAPLPAPAGEALIVADQI